MSTAQQAAHPKRKVHKPAWRKEVQARMDRMISYVSQHWTPSGGVVKNVGCFTVFVGLDEVDIGASVIFYDSPLTRAILYDRTMLDRLQALVSTLPARLPDVTGGPGTGTTFTATLNPASFRDDLLSKSYLRNVWSATSYTTFLGEYRQRTDNN